MLLKRAINSAAIKSNVIDYNQGCVDLPKEGFGVTFAGK
jgi:hypothetical protein